MSDTKISIEKFAQYLEENARVVERWPTWMREGASGRSTSSSDRDPKAREDKVEDPKR